MDYLRSATPTVSVEPAVKHFAVRRTGSLTRWISTWCGVLVVCASCQFSVAQTTPYWDGGFGVQGVSGTVNDIAISGDSVVVVGVFAQAGDQLVNNIALFRDGELSSLSSGLNGEISTVELGADGVIYTGGNFSISVEQQTPLNNVAKWNGSDWEALGDGFNDDVRDLVLVDDTLYAVGAFSHSGSTQLNQVGKWTGEEWVPLGTGVSRSGLPARVNAIVSNSSGDIFIGGRFDTAGTVEATSLARWNGINWDRPWDDLGNTQPIGVSVHDLEVVGDSLYVAGNFSHAGSIPVGNIAILDSNLWTGIGGSFVLDPVESITLSPAGVLYTTGLNSDGTAFASYDGTTWTAHGEVDEFRAPYELEAGVDGRVFAGSLQIFLPSEPYATQFLHVWDPALNQWIVLDESSNGIDGVLFTIVPDPVIEGNFYAGGNFEFAGSERAPSIAYWNGDGWDAVGDSLSGDIYSIAVDRSDDIIAGGSFFIRDQQFPQNLARWDGTSWEAIEGLTYSIPGEITVLSLAVEQDTLWVGGVFDSAGTAISPYLARWDLQQDEWLPPSGTPNGPVVSMHHYEGGLVIGGFFDEITPFGSLGYVARRDNGSWVAMDSGSTAPVQSLTSGDGSLYATGGFGGSDIGKWTDTTWESLAVTSVGGDIQGLAVAANGRLFVGGRFSALEADGIIVEADGLASFRGGTWEPVADLSLGHINVLQVRGQDLVVGGQFLSVQPLPDNETAKLVSENIGILRNATRLETDQPENVVASEFDLNVYPNPVFERLTISINTGRAEVANLKIYDVLGRRVQMVRSNLVPGRNEVSVSALSLSNGVYFVSLSMQTGLQSATFVVSR